jgi:hypothetical protein
MAATGIRADFDIARAGHHLRASDAPLSPHIECKVVQYQCDYLHPYNIFTIRAISVLIPPCPFAARD